MRRVGGSYSVDEEKERRCMQHGGVVGVLLVSGAISGHVHQTNYTDVGGLMRESTNQELCGTFVH